MFVLSIETFRLRTLWGNVTFIKWASYWIEIHAHKSKRFRREVESFSWVHNPVFSPSLFRYQAFLSLSFCRFTPRKPVSKARHFASRGWMSMMKVSTSCNDVTGEHCSRNHDEFIRTANYLPVDGVSLNVRKRVHMQNAWSSIFYRGKRGRGIWKFCLAPSICLLHRIN